MTCSALYPGNLVVITLVSHCMAPRVGGAGRKTRNVSSRGDSRSRKGAIQMPLLRPSVPWRIIETPG
eukprot:scaffold540137_cov130-Attheya_sp.AAC.1